MQARIFKSIAVSAAGLTILLVAPPITPDLAAQTGQAGTQQQTGAHVRPHILVLAPRGPAGHLGPDDAGGKSLGVDAPKINQRMFLVGAIVVALDWHRLRLRVFICGRHGQRQHAQVLIHEVLGRMLATLDGACQTPDVRGWNSTVTGMSGNECGVVCGERDEGWRSDKAASGSETCSQSERRAATSTARAGRVEKYSRRINKAER